MNFDQDFMDWLKADDKARGTGLLLAPINLDQQDEASNVNEILPAEENTHETDTQDSRDFEEELAPISIELSDEDAKFIESFNPDEEEVEGVDEEPQEPENTFPPEFDDPDVDINKAWQEHATGFELSLDEPPHEIWTRINEANSEYDDEDEEVEYEQGESLIGAAYEQKREHGKNFTERLQHTLKGRKKKAEQAREEEESRKPHHPYILKGAKMCTALLITLGLACLALWFIQRWTPDKINERAQNLYEQRNYDEAMNLFQEGYKRYPNVLTFLTGLAQSAEKAGHVQTAKAAWNEYIHFLPEKDTENKRHAQDELKRLSPDIEPEPEPKTPEPETKNESHDIELQLPSKPPVVPVTFDEFLTEANKAFNLGMYNVAIIYFFRAMELNGSDIRAYIGLAESFRLKGMKFDSGRIINEARKKFRRNTTIETIAKFLEGEN